VLKPSAKHHLIYLYTINPAICSPSREFTIKLFQQYTNAVSKSLQFDSFFTPSQELLVFNQFSPWCLPEYVNIFMLLSYSLLRFPLLFTHIQEHLQASYYSSQFSHSNEVLLQSDLTISQKDKKKCEILLISPIFYFIPFLYSPYRNIRLLVLRLIATYLSGGHFDRPRVLQTSTDVETSSNLQNSSLHQSNIGISKSISMSSSVRGAASVGGSAEVAGDDVNVLSTTDLMHHTNQAQIIQDGIIEYLFETINTFLIAACQNIPTMHMHNQQDENCENGENFENFTQFYQNSDFEQSETQNMFFSHSPFTLAEYHILVYNIFIRIPITPRNPFQTINDLKLTKSAENVDIFLDGVYLNQTDNVPYFRPKTSSCGLFTTNAAETAQFDQQRQWLCNRPIALQIGTQLRPEHV
jgi:hypothetical protein